MGQATVKTTIKTTNEDRQMDNNGVLGNLMNNTYGQDLIRNIIGTMYTPEQISAFKPADMADVSKRVGDFMSDPKWTRNNPMQMQQGQGQTEMAGLPALTPEELLEVHQPMRMPQGQGQTEMAGLPALTPEELLELSTWRMRPAQPQQRRPTPEELQEASQYVPMRMRQGQGQQVAYNNAYAATGQGQTLAQMISNQPDYADATTRAYNDYWGSRSTPSTPSAPSAPSAPKARPKDAVTGGVIRQGKMTPTTYESYR